jgi:hypothetical protein
MGPIGFVLLSAKFPATAEPTSHGIVTAPCDFIRDDCRHSRVSRRHKFDKSSGKRLEGKIFNPSGILMTEDRVQFGFDSGVFQMKDLFFFGPMFTNCRAPVLSRRGLLRTLLRVREK